MLELLGSALVAVDGRAMDPDVVRPGWLALGIVAILGVVLVALLFSFARHARRAAEPWEGETVEKAEASDPRATADPDVRS